VKYAIIQAYEGTHSISMMCRVMGVNRGGYYSWRDRAPSPRSERRKQMEAQIKETYEAFEARYGARRIARELNELGFNCSTNYVAGIMKEESLKARNGKGFNYRHQNLSMVNVSDNLLWRNFKANAPNQKWTSDITYIWVEDQWIYLATVMDLYSRRIVGWSLDRTMTEELTKRALDDALNRRNVEPGLILHSDRGVQYRAQKYIDFATSNGLQLSMSRKGNCWDNAPMESFFSRLKVELIYAKNYRSVQEAKTGIFEYIEIFYNRKRRHSANDNLSPVVFEERAALAA